MLTWVVVVGAILSIAVVITIIYLVVARLSDDATPPTTTIPPVAGQSTPPATEVPWSAPITVKAGKWSTPIWAAPKQCFDIVIHSGAPNTVDGLREHSRILPWGNLGRPQDWIENNGGEFRGIVIGCADTDLTFSYRFLPHRCP